MKRTPFDGLTVQEAEIPWLAQRLIALRLPALIKASSGESGLSPALQQRLSLRSALVVPLAARGRFLGLLWLDDTRSPHYFTSDEINIVQGIAAQVPGRTPGRLRRARSRGPRRRRRGRPDLVRPPAEGRDPRIRGPSDGLD